MYYFAYGSNMNHKQMQRRCPNSKFIKPVYLENAKFIYDGKSIAWNEKAVANIVTIDAGQVWGGIFEIDEDNLAELDCCEGFPKSYGKGIVNVKDEEGNVFQAWAYYRAGEKQGVPSTSYRNIILQGAKDCGLPEEYIKDNL